MSKVGVAVSGGVDSSAAAYLLKSQGHDVLCIYMRLDDREGDADSAKATAELLGLPFYVLDIREVFDKTVKSYFTSSYMNGETPNPCVVCNREIKFGALFEYARSLGCEYLATGHYARTDGIHILRSSVPDKDQSYCLWQVDRSVIGRIMFPIGGLAKPEVRALADAAGIPAAKKKDSQDICFVPDGDYRAFLKERLHTEFEQGFFKDASGNILGRHNGFQCYTVGQRKGLGISSCRPLYVIDKDACSNTVILGDDSDLFKDSISLRDVRMQADVPDEFESEVKIRFRAKDAHAHVTLCGDKAKVRFDLPQRAPAKGQSAVFYSGDILLGGGIIE